MIVFANNNIVFANNNNIVFANNNIVFANNNNNIVFASNNRYVQEFGGFRHMMFQLRFGVFTFSGSFIYSRSWFMYIPGLAFAFARFLCFVTFRALVLLVTSLPRSLLVIALALIVHRTCATMVVWICVPCIQSLLFMTLSAVHFHAYSRPSLRSSRTFRVLLLFRA